MKNALLLLGLIILSCNRPLSKPLVQIEESDVEQEFGKVVFMGKSDDSVALKYFNVTNFSDLNIKNYYDDVEVIKDSLFLTIDSITGPQIFNIFASSKSKGYSYAAQFILKPNDTVVFEIKDLKLKFIGENTNKNNFYSSMWESTPKYRLNSYKGSIQSYKQSVDSIYNIKLNFLNQYIKDYKITSTSFISNVKLDLKYEHLVQLVAPRIKKSAFGNFSNDYNGLISIVQKEYKNKEILFDFGDYLENISIDDLQNDEHLKYHSFRQLLNPLIRNYFIDSDYPNFSKEKLIEQKLFIEENFDNKIREYLLGVLIFSHHTNGFGSSINEVSFLRELIIDYKNIYPNSIFKERLKEILEELKTYDFELSDSALDSKFVNHLSDTLTLRKVFERSNKRIKVVNFWASWCPPCIPEIRDGKPFKDRLLVENNVEWIYLSIDENHQQWLERSKELEDVLNFNNSFFVLNGKNSSLGKSLKVDWIPRYVIFNKENKVILHNAPRPSDNIIFEKIIDEIE